jgi:hypothetical protein
MKGKNKTPYSQLTSIKYYKVGECTSRSRKRSDAKVGLYKYRVGKGLMPLHFVNQKKNTSKASSNHIPRRPGPIVIQGQSFTIFATV